MIATNGEGRYDIVELRPGTYTITFSLAGFRTFRREQIEDALPAPTKAEMEEKMMRFEDYLLR